MDQLIRDLTQVAPRSKSEVREKLMELYIEAYDRGAGKQIYWEYLRTEEKDILLSLINKK